MPEELEVHCYIKKKENEFLSKKLYSIQLIHSIPCFNSLKICNSFTTSLLSAVTFNQPKEVLTFRVY